MSFFPTIDPEQLVLLLVAGFCAAVLLQHLVAWSVRLGAGVHMWGWVWAAGGLAWCVARAFETGSYDLSPELAARWHAVSVVALLPTGVGLVGVVGMARRRLLEPRAGTLASAVCLGGAVLLFALAYVSPPRLVTRTDWSGAAVVLARPGAADLGVAVAALVAAWLYIFFLQRRQPLSRGLRVLLLAGVTAWLAALANDLLMGAGLITTSALSSVGLLALGVALTSVVGTDPAARPEDIVRTLAAHRRRTEEQNALLARALADARDAGEARQRFLARMSHELRTPLNGVLGMTDLALDSQLDQTQRHYLVQAHASAQELLSLVDDLLDLARLEAGRMALAEESFKLRPCLEDTLRLVGAQAAPKGLELVLDAPEDLPRKLVGDPVRLRQVLVNLLGNAVKFTERGQVVLRARATHEHQGRLGVRFSVVDTGPGIPLEEQHLILQPFVQGAAGEGRGTGLGLAICQELVRRMGSKLEVDSTPGQGSTFSFDLGLGLPDADDEITHVDPVLLVGLPVLLAEDNADTARAIVRELHAWRVVVTVVEDGRRALRALDEARRQGRPFPLLLLDSDMPQLDGWQVLREVALDRGLVASTVFMLPTGAPATQYRRSRALGADATIAKPVRAAELLQAVLAAVGAGLSDPAIDLDPVTDPGGRVRVLVADDHAVNRELVAAVLSAQGADVRVVAGGAEAVRTVGADDFDLVLMDVRMPGIDGPEATRQIRRHEAAAGGRRVPIVALTAHVMPGDRERLLALGMDGYLTKPLDRGALRDVLDRYRADPLDPTPSGGVPDPGLALGSGSGSGSSSAHPLRAAPAELPREGAIDRERLDQLTGGDDDLARDLGRLMLAELPGHRQRLGESLEQEDPTAVFRAAHALCGAAGNMGAVDLRTRAAALEAAGRDQDLDAAWATWPDLQAELTRLDAALVDMLSA